MSDIYYFEQQVGCSCDDSVDSLLVSVIADGIPVSRQKINKPFGSFGFAAADGAEVVLTVTPIVNGKESESSITRTLVAPCELSPAYGTMLGNLTVDRKHVLEAEL